MSGALMPLNEVVARSTGQKSLIDAKMKEFEGLLLIGNKVAADAVRVEALTLLDSYFDCQAEFVENVRRGRYT